MDYGSNNMFSTSRTAAGEAIESITHSLRVTSLLPDAVLELASDVENHIREILQEAMKCMRHSRRIVLVAEDVERALSLKDMKPLCGLPLVLKRAGTCGHMLNIKDKDLDFEEVIEDHMPNTDANAYITSHWLAIEGIQPAIPENVSVGEASCDGKKLEYKDEGFVSDIKLFTKQILSTDMQLYFDKITDLAIRPASSLFKQALVSLETDPALQPIIPYFACFIAKEVARNLNDFSTLFALMRAARSIIQNPHIHIEPYIHLLMPSIITCLVGRRLGNELSDKHWELRNFSADLVATICKRYRLSYHNLQPRVMRTLLHVFLNPVKSLPQHYGAIQGLSALGSHAVRFLVLPNIETYLLLLKPEMFHNNDTKRHQEAWRVYGALLRAAGSCTYDWLKSLVPNVATSAPSTRKCCTGAATSLPRHDNKKAGTENLMQQPELKMACVIGSTKGVYSAAMGALRVGEIVCRPHKSNVLAQAWKDDVDRGQLLVSLFELFGEAVLAFVPRLELHMFI